jgi:LPXTG-motif cell wall-anchored protein
VSPSRLLGAFVLVSLALPVLARADADPASDSLYVGRIFLPLSAKVSPSLARQLDADTIAAEKARRPVRVALIASRTDLGGVPSLFGKPAAYARFLAAELQFVYPGKVLIVMPQGAALAERARLVANADVIQAKVGPGADGLARAAIVLVEKLADVHARPIAGAAPPSTTPATVHVSTAPPASKKTGGIPAWAAAAIAVGAVALLLALGFLLVRRRRRASAADWKRPDPDDPYRYTGP